uniref:Uncharacterized protein n=1 Tax=Nelumbo nucifera TaxID=4432 RepID=A0A822XPU7_NELNU|nr:TPA_asm: hypothetical protein HUJ06_022409 [Nelumbo nucifera]
MESRRCLNALTHQLRSLASLNSSFQSLRALHHLLTLVASDPLLLENPTSITYRIGHTFEFASCIKYQTVRPYSSGRRNSSKPQNDDDDNEADEDDDIDEDEDENEEEMGATEKETIFRCQIVYPTDLIH